jgi:hypothetical protein
MLVGSDLGICYADEGHRPLLPRYERVGLRQLPLGLGAMFFAVCPAGPLAVAGNP